MAEFANFLSQQMETAVGQMLQYLLAMVVPLLGLILGGLALNWAVGWVKGITASK
jgi:hypothetical protein